MAEPVICYDLNTNGYKLNDIVKEPNDEFKVIDKYEFLQGLVKIDKGYEVDLKYFLPVLISINAPVP